MSGSFIGTPVVTMVDGLPPELSQGNVGFRDQAWGQCWLFLLVFWVSFFDFLRDENDSANCKRILVRKGSRKEK